MLSFSFFSSDLQAQKKSEKFVKYIETYCDIAVEQMKLHKIPASITLAQGILESAGGESELAQKSRNHFGIKCGGDWTGPSVTHYDDGRNECFRSYKKVSESYEDHSLFLVNRAWYAPLFELPITDYEGWANGLKKAGYATDPNYPTRLITLVETYELHLYDQIGLGVTDPKPGKEDPTPGKEDPTPGKEDPVPIDPSTGIHEIYKANGLLYIIARKGDTFETIAKEVEMKAKKLIEYNDLVAEYKLSDGDIIYLEKKNTKAPRGFTLHQVKAGESMHSISQIYGIRLKNLYKLNRQSADYVPEVGTLLRVR